MATRTKPLITAAALATAAAIAVASPAIAPNLTPAPAALSAAQVELTTFSDLLSITPADWGNYFFVGYGGAIGPNQITPVETLPDYWLPNCAFDCTIAGVSGVSYLALDALINGNGGGIADLGNWKISAINYLFEGGISSAVQYTLQQPFITGAPLANPAIFNAIGVLFEGGYALTNLYYQALSTIAVLAKNVPLVGEYLYRGIGSYIGPPFQTVDSVYDYSNIAGLSPGVLRYVIGVLTTPVTITGGPLNGVTLPFGNPNPYPLAVTPEPAAAVAALSSPVAAAKSASVDTGTAAPVVEAEVAAPKAGETPPADSTPAAGGSSEGTSTEAASDTTVPDTTVPDTKPADTKPADTTPAVDSPSNAVADSTADATPAATKPADAPAKAAKRPVRSALERATKKIASAIAGPAAKAAPAADGSADSGTSAG
jgi:hypothetical protein